MSEFPILVPAMTVLVEIQAPEAVGSASRGAPLSVVPMAGGTIRSHPDFPVALDANLTGTGSDFIHNDPDNKHMRLNAHSTAKDKSGALFYLNYTGIVEITDSLVKILSGAPDAETTKFGNSFIEIRFETGDARLRELETNTFVGAGRFVVEQGKPVVVEYRVSKVGWSP